MPGFRELLDVRGFGTPAGVHLGLRGADVPTLEDLAALPWAMAYHTVNFTTSAMSRLAARGLEPRVDVVVDSFHVLPQFIAGTDRVGLLQGRLARAIAPSLDLRVLPFPVDTAPLTETFWWHPAHTPDPGHAWFRDAVRASAAAIVDLEPEP